MAEMSRFWPWSAGAPAEDEHSELEEQMSPDPQGENAAYDLKAARQQATAGGAAPGAQQAGAASKPGALQQR